LSGATIKDRKQFFGCPQRLELLESGPRIRNSIENDRQAAGKGLGLDESKSDDPVPLLATLEKAEDHELVKGKDGSPRERTTFGFHAFRHTCASLLFAEGRNVKQVQRWLGHAKASITLDTYLHLLDEGVGEPLEIDAGGNRTATGGPERVEDESPAFIG
jgi:integrase